MADGDRPQQDGRNEIRLERVLGRRVHAANNRPAGRIEEFRAEQRGSGFVITEYVLGRTGLVERLHVAARHLLGLKHRSYIVRWDQLDISNPERPRLLCSLNDLTEE